MGQREPNRRPVPTRKLYKVLKVFSFIFPNVPTKFRGKPTSFERLTGHHARCGPTQAQRRPVPTPDPNMIFFF